MAMTTTIRTAHQGKTHWVQLGVTWCGKPIKLNAATLERTDDQVRAAIAAGSWCKLCADGWRMAVGSREKDTRKEARL
jgi:hypothetical protein